MRVLLDEGDPAKVEALEQAFLRNHVTEDVLFATGRGVAPWMASVTFGGPDLRTVYIGSPQRPAHSLLPRPGGRPADGALARTGLDSGLKAPTVKDKGLGTTLGGGIGMTDRTSGRILWGVVLSLSAITATGRVSGQAPTDAPVQLTREEDHARTMKDARVDRRCRGAR